MHHVQNSRSLFAAAAALAAGVSMLATDASAVSTRVKLACAKDYYAHCSKHAPGSPEVRSCMRAVGDGLSPRCVNALVAEGEVSEKEVAGHAGKNDD
ncbi:MAG: hypothetical protein HOO99_08225 [Hyphomicrobiaceae bacterium]|nr:hypothetical protein [Hyphomicrobiaceae bacterium]